MSDPNIKKLNNYINPALISKSTDVEEMMDDGTYSFEKWEDLLEVMIQFMRFPIMRTEYLLRKVMPFRELFPKEQFLNLLAFKLSRDLPESDQKDLDFGRLLPFRKVKRKNAPELAYDGTSAKEFKLREEKRKLESLVTNLQRNNSHLQKEVKKYKRRSKSNVHDIKDGGHGRAQTSMPRLSNKSSKNKRDSLKVLKDFVDENSNNENKNNNEIADDEKKSGSEILKVKSPRISNMKQHNGDDDEDKPPHRRGISITSDQADDIKVGDVTSSFTITFARLLNQDDGGNTYDQLKERMERRRGAGGSKKEEKEKQRKLKIQAEKERRQQAKMARKAQSSALYDIRQANSSNYSKKREYDYDFDSGSSSKRKNRNKSRDKNKNKSPNSKKNLLEIASSETDEVDGNGTISDNNTVIEHGSDSDTEQDTDREQNSRPNSTRDRPASTTKKKTNKSQQVGRNTSKSVNNKSRKKGKKKKKLRATDLELPLYKDTLTIAERKRGKQEKKLLRRMELQIGDKVQLKRGDRKGIVRYIGPAHWVYGYVIGLELIDNSQGKHSGNMGDIWYFETGRGSRGLFVKIESISKIIEKRKKRKNNKQPKNSKNMTSPWYSDSDDDNGDSSGDEDGNGYELDVSEVPRKERERIIRLNLERGDVVTLDHGRRGVIHYCGPVDWSDDIMFGIELLDKAAGKHNGIVDGVEYFQCEDNRGIFTPLNKVRKKGTLNQDMAEW